MIDIAKILIIIGCFLVFAGIYMSLLVKIPGFGKLPGDILIKKGNFTFYFPLMTCIAISLIISFLLHLWHQK